MRPGSASCSTALTAPASPQTAGARRRLRRRAGRRCPPGRSWPAWRACQAWRRGPAAVHAVCCQALPAPAPLSSLSRPAQLARAAHVVAMSGSRRSSWRRRCASCGAGHCCEHGRRRGRGRLGGLAAGARAGGRAAAGRLAGGRLAAAAPAAAALPAVRAPRGRPRSHCLPLAPLPAALPGSRGRAGLDVDRSAAGNQMRCARSPDRLPAAAAAHAAEALGAELAEAAAPDLGQALSDALPGAPLLLLLAPGGDPGGALLRLAAAHGAAGGLASLALGQGQVRAGACCGSSPRPPLARARSQGPAACSIRRHAQLAASSCCLPDGCGLLGGLAEARALQHMACRARAGRGGAGAGGSGGARGPLGAAGQLPPGARLPARARGAGRAPGRRAAAPGLPPVADGRARRAAAGAPAAPVRQGRRAPAAGARQRGSLKSASRSWWQGRARCTLVRAACQACSGAPPRLPGRGRRACGGG
jgi:hypothetical protein